MANVELIPHLFRTEYRKIVSTLCRRFGFDQIEIAEDIASDTFLTASQTWPLHGVPDNPTAWLYTVAKNRAKNWLSRQSVFQTAILPELTLVNGSPKEEFDFSDEYVKDSQLRMMFAVCRPSIPSEAQIGLSLRILCGFGIDEIADAFLTNKETINKRLFRAKEKLRQERIDLEVPTPAEMDRRLKNVLTTIYLLFSEGYYSTSQNTTLRKDLCFEAMRLCMMLVENPSTDKPEVNALLALMCFHASRFEARINSKGEFILYGDQDPNLWDTELTGRGGYYLHRSTGGSTLSRYHLEASIAYWHTQKADTSEKWDNILQLFNKLLQMEYSPIAALNRTYALAKVKGKQAAITEAEKLKLTDNQFYFALLGELYRGIDSTKAKQNLQKALALAKTQTDKQTIQKQLAAI